MHNNNNTAPAEYPTEVKSDVRQRNADLALFNLLQTEDFRDYVWSLLEQCHIFQTTFTGNSQSYFQEGERNMGLKVLHQVNDCDPDAYIKMMHKSLQKNNNS